MLSFLFLLGHIHDKKCNFHLKLFPRLCYHIINHEMCNLFFVPLWYSSRTYGDILGPVVSKLVAFGQSNAELKENMDKMSTEIHDHKLLVRQLKVLVFIL